MNDPQTVTEHHRWHGLPGGDHDATFEPAEGCTRPLSPYGRAAGLINEYVNGEKETVNFDRLDDLDREALIDVARLAMVRLRQIRQIALALGPQLIEDL